MAGRLDTISMRVTVWTWQKIPRNRTSINSSFCLIQMTITRHHSKFASNTASESLSSYQPCHGKNTVMARTQGPRPLGFNEKEIRKIRAFKKWKEVPSGELYEYRNHIFERGSDGEDKWLMRLIWSSMKNNRSEKSMEHQRQRSKYNSVKRKAEEAIEPKRGGQSVS